jgi:5-methylcytosine-specific restriction endonuclease McrA
MQQRVLLLDKNYVALSIVPWRKAVKLLVKGKAESISTPRNCYSIKYAKGNFEIPEIIRLLVVIPWRAHQVMIRFSRRNMLVRDNGECQYCGAKVGKKATIDHIVPRSRGGLTNYTNCVVSCGSCNNTKADKTLEEVGMKLKHNPRRPSFISLYKAYLEDPPEEWCAYIMGLDK